MKLIDNYIRKQLVAVIMIVLLVLLGVDFFFALVNETRFIGIGNYKTSNAMLFLLLTLPRRMYVLFPWAALVGTLLALGHIAKNGELVAIEVTIISRKRIAWSVIKGSLFLVFLMIVIGEVIAPKAERIAQNMKTRAFSRGNVLHTDYGVWIRNNNEFLHIRAIKNRKILDDITRFRFNTDLQLEELIKAKRAIKQRHGWVLFNVEGTTFSLDATKHFSQKEVMIPELLDTDVLETISEKHLERLSVLQLWRIINVRSNNDLSIEAYQTALWSKFVYPLGIIIMIYMGVPFIFGPLRSTTIGSKIVVGLGLSFSYFIANSIFLHLPLIIGLHPFVACIIPAVGFFCIGSSLFYKATK